MLSLWTHHQIGILIFLSVILCITLSNIKIMRKLGSYPRSKDLPLVSVLVPARNEERNIGGCVESLLAQDYPNFEVLVLDDNSTDGSWQILSQLSAKDARLRILKGLPLPEGWLGKHWACHQLAKQAQGEMLLFTDADTRHNPNSLRDGISAMISEKADMVTAFPYEETKTWGERLTVSLFPWFALCFLPLIVAYRTRSPAFSAAVGQFMLISRKAYEQIGGYASIKEEVVDDVALARRIKAQGLRWRIALGQDQLRCRMYQGFKEAYQGFTKNLFAGFGYRILPFIFVWTYIGLAFLEPIFVLLSGVFGIKPSLLTTILAGSEIFISTLIWGASHWRFRFPLYMVLLYPISVIVLLTIAFGSLFLSVTGRSTWKGRSISKPAIRWI